jgi:hypothetical protein
VCVALSQYGHDLMAARPAPLWAGWAALAGSAPPSLRMEMRGGGMHAAMDGGMAVSHGAGTSLGMLAAHAFAGCLAAAWLYAGERALRRALRVVAELADRTLRVLALLVRAFLPAYPRPARGPPDH